MTINVMMLCCRLLAIHTSDPMTQLSESYGWRYSDLQRGHFAWRCRFLVEQAHAMGLTVIDRCNLTVLLEPGQEDLVGFLAEHRVGFYGLILLLSAMADMHSPSGWLASALDSCPLSEWDLESRMTNCLQECLVGLGRSLCN